VIVVGTPEVDEGVFDGVGEQFRERHRERRRQIGREHTEFAVDDDLDRVQANTVSSTSSTSDCTISSKTTSSPGSRDNTSCTTAIERIRRSASNNGVRSRRCRCGGPAVATAMRWSAGCSSRGGEPHARRPLC
jgi:hypothetical protein